MLPIPNVTIRKCTRQNVTIRKCTIRNVTDPFLKNFKFFFYSDDHREWKNMLDQTPNSNII